MLLLFDNNKYGVKNMTDENEYATEYERTIKNLKEYLREYAELRTMN